MKRELVIHLEREKLARIGDATGRRAEEWAAKSITTCIAFRLGEDGSKVPTAYFGRPSP